MAFVQFIQSHLGATLGAAVAGSSLLTGFAFKYAQAKLPGIIKQEEEALLDALFVRLTRPEDKAALKAVLLAVRARFPDAGAACFAVAADECIKELPALSPYRDQIVKLLTAIEQAAEDGLDEESKKP
jgi:hypothetical protein